VSGLSQVGCQRPTEVAVEFASLSNRVNVGLGAETPLWFHRVDSDWPEECLVRHAAERRKLHDSFCQGNQP
jgi:hypothetical protein